MAEQTYDSKKNHFQVWRYFTSGFVITYITSGFSISQQIIIFFQPYATFIVISSLPGDDLSKRSSKVTISVVDDMAILSLCT
jgi:hypothetical protein